MLVGLHLCVFAMHIYREGMDPSGYVTETSGNEYDQPALVVSVM